VRVPVVNAHSISITAELERDYELADVRKAFEDAPGLILVDDPQQNKYPLATEASGQDLVLVGRIRRDFSAKNSVNFWTVADNIRKGAATNTIQIAELFTHQA